MTVGIVIQARLGSVRFPGKVLADLHGAPMLLREVERLRRVDGVDRLIVATSDNPKDDPVADLIAGSDGVDLWRGPEEDVLARFAGAARAFDLDVVGRVTGDCPLIDPGVVAKVLRAFQADGGADYCSNCRPRSYPHGFDVEFASRRALEETDRAATDPFDREHVLVAIFTKPERYRCRNVLAEDDRHHDLRLTVDYPADLDFMRALYAALYDADPGFGLEAIVDLLAKEPALRDIQKGLPVHESITDASQRGQVRRPRLEGTR